MLQTKCATSIDQSSHSGQTRFGIVMSDEHYQKITRKLELLKEKVPINSTITLRFQHRASCIKGILTIKSPNKTFTSQQMGHYPLHTFLNLEEDIEEQIALWKKYRFKNIQVMRGA